VHIVRRQQDLGHRKFGASVPKAGKTRCTQPLRELAEFLRHVSDVGIADPALGLLQQPMPHVAKDCGSDVVAIRCIGAGLHWPVSRRGPAMALEITPPCGAGSK
jgi:hypothetical protein